MQAPPLTAMRSSCIQPCRSRQLHTSAPADPNRASANRLCYKAATEPSGRLVGRPGPHRRSRLLNSVARIPLIPQLRHSLRPPPPLPPRTAALAKGTDSRVQISIVEGDRPRRRWRRLLSLVRVPRIPQLRHTHTPTPPQPPPRRVAPHSLETEGVQFRLSSWATGLVDAPPLARPHPDHPSTASHTPPPPSPSPPAPRRTED